MAEQTYQDYRQSRIASGSPAAGAAPPAESQGTITPVEQAESQDSPPASPEEGEEFEGTPQEKARDRRLENRFRRLTDRLRAKDREIAELRGELTAVVQMVRPAPPEPPSGRPRRETYADDDAYLDALIDWKTTTQTPSVPTGPPVPAEVAPQQAYLTRLGEAKKQYADFDEVVESTEVRVSDAVRDALLESEHGPALVYFLAQHADEAQRLNSLNAVALGRALARLEGQMTAPPPPTTRTPNVQPPSPLRPVSGGIAPVAPPEPDKLSFRDYKEARRKGQIR